MAGRYQVDGHTLASRRRFLTWASASAAFCLEQYKGGSDQLTALGDEHGLLLIMKRGRILSFDAAEKKAAEVFRTVARIHGTKRAKYVAPTLPYEVFVQT